MYILLLFFNFYFLCFCVLEGLGVYLFIYCGGVGGWCWNYSFPLLQIPAARMPAPLPPSP